MEIVPDAKIICFCGRQISFSRADISDAIPLTLQFIYLDVDICVSMSGDDKNNLQVYTKNEEWIKSRKQNVSVIGVLARCINLVAYMTILTLMNLL